MIPSTSLSARFFPSGFDGTDVRTEISGQRRRYRIGVGVDGTCEHQDHGGILQQEEAQQGHRQRKELMVIQWWTVILSIFR